MILLRIILKNVNHTPLHPSCSQMALFYISGCTDTGSCNQPQTPFTHQSKKLLCFCSPSPHQSLLSPTLFLHPLCCFSYFFVSKLILLHKIEPCLDSFTPSVQSRSQLPTLPFPSHSLFLFNVMLPCLHFPDHPLNPLKLKDSLFPPFQSYSKKDSSVLRLMKALHATA